ncbi:MAG: hypothetical protein PUA72_08105 [Lachnospiraceae bacterium]|nr:hypothetical protein [Lachnospiraceae bacterium]
MDKVYKIAEKDLNWTTAEAETAELVIWYDLGQLPEELYGVARLAIQREQRNAYFQIMEEQFGLCWSAQHEIDRFRLRVQLDFRKRQTDLKLVVIFADPVEAELYGSVILSVRPEVLCDDFERKVFDSVAKQFFYGESGSVIVEEICRISYNEGKRSRRQSNGSEAGYL